MVELVALKENGLGILYLGVESGHEETLKHIRKGTSAQNLINMGRKVREAGIKLSVTVLLGIAGVEGSLEHARATGELLSAMDPRWDVVIPETSAGLEPLCAVYSKQMLPTIENNLKGNRFKIRQSFRKGRVKKFKASVLREQDPELVSFFNVNTPEDLERAVQIEKTIFSWM